MLTLWKLDQQLRDRLEDLLEAEETLSAVEYNKESTAEQREDAREAVAEAQEALAEVSELVGNKLGNYAKYIQNLDNLKKGVELKIKEFTRRKNAITRTAEWLKDNLSAYLSVHGMRSVYAGEFKIAKQKNSQPSVILNIDAEALPTEFQRLTIEANKEALKEALNNGTEIDGVALITGEHIRIRVS